MTDIPRRTVTRTAKLATLPLGVAGRAALGLGKRLGGRPAVESPRSCSGARPSSCSRVLGQLKGGAMKFGQALSVFEAALPDELAAPYREALTKLQEARAADAGGDRAPDARRAARPRTGGAGSASSTTPRPRPRASARCTAR